MTVILPEDVSIVAVCVPDNVGRLAGKRIPAARWQEVLNTGLPMPNFHLVTGLDNVPYGDLEITGHHTGFCNGVLRPLPETMFRLLTSPGEALVLADAFDLDGRPVEQTPRIILKRQVERLRERGLSARCATELEFYLFRQSYAESRATGYYKLQPFHPLNADNDILLAGYAEPFLSAVRSCLEANGLTAPSTQGEGGRGQYEINLPPADPLTAADNHVFFKHTVRALAHRDGLAATFMAKVDAADAGSSGHVHLSLTGPGGAPFFGTDGELSAQGACFLAGVLAYAPELCWLHAPYANSYKRIRPGTFAPANTSWAWQSRSVMVRLIASGGTVRCEFRLPGADANPYFSVAGLIAAGLAGLDSELPLPPETIGDAYSSGATALPRDLTEAVRTFTASPVAAAAFGDDVHRHLAALADHEQQLFQTVVTDWERIHGFERA